MVREVSSVLAGQLRRRPAETTASSAASPGPGFSKWWGRSASNVKQSPVASSWRSPSMSRTTRPDSTRALSRLPGSCIGGSPAPPVRAPAASVWRLSSARWPGSGAVRTSNAWPCSGEPPLRRSPARTTVTVPASSRRRSWLRRSSRPAAMRLATWSVGLVSPRSTWLSIGALTPERSARSRSERSIASRSALTRGPMWIWVSATNAIPHVRYRIRLSTAAYRYHMAMARTQTLVQFSDELIERLDRYRARAGRSRSDVIREAVEQYLAADRESEIDRRLVEAYTRQPPTDVWGDEAAKRLIAEEPW